MNVFPRGLQPLRPHAGSEVADNEPESGRAKGSGSLACQAPEPAALPGQCLARFVIPARESNAGNTLRTLLIRGHCALR